MKKIWIPLISKHGKSKLPFWLNASQNIALLQAVVEMLCQDELAANELYYRHRLEESIRQAEAGQMKPATEVHQIARQWINKSCAARLMLNEPEHHYIAEVVRGDTNHGSTTKRP